MEFCDNLSHLLQAYFRDFTIERLDKPWHAFTASWNRAAIARHLGISYSFVTGQHCYVMVGICANSAQTMFRSCPSAGLWYTVV